MAQQLLYGLDVLAIRFHQSAERVSQRMPSHVARNSRRLERRFEVSAKERAWPVRLFAFLVWTGKHPIARLWIRALKPPIEQDFRQFRIESNRLPGGLRFAASDLLLDHGPSDVYLQRFEVHVLPFEAK